MIFTGLDLLILMMDFSSLNSYLKSYILLLLMFYLMIFVEGAGMYISYKAYRVFKSAFNE
jgi:hypothetical protein